MPRVRGVTLSLYYPEDRDSAATSLRRIARLGANCVAIPIPLEQSSVESESVYAVPGFTPTDSLLLYVARLARAESLDVTYFPLLNLRQVAPGKWRGTLRPGSWERWFGSYRARILHYARVAREGDVATLCVGAELNSSEARVRLWEALLDSVRMVYPGRLIYSQNWDFTRALPFAKRLDGVGFNAYFELSPRPDPPLRALLARWRELGPGLARRARGYGGGLLVTELGYPSSDKAARRPWDYIQAPLSRPRLQARCFEAFRRYWAHQGGLEGVYVYLWSARDSAGDAGYSIRGKPAAEVIGAWFHGGMAGRRARR